MKISIEKFDSIYAQEAAKLEALCFSQPWSQMQLSEAAASPLYRMLSAMLGESFAGYCGFQYVQNEGYITNVAVLPEFRCMGVGSALVNGMCDCARDMGLSFLTLEVRLSNEDAVRLYEKHGFKPVGNRKGFYASPREDALLMTNFFEGECNEYSGN